jgi:hypothetical protein
MFDTTYLKLEVNELTAVKNSKKNYSQQKQRIRKMSHQFSFIIQKQQGIWHKFLLEFNAKQHKYSNKRKYKRARISYKKRTCLKRQNCPNNIKSVVQ